MFKTTCLLSKKAHLKSPCTSLLTPNLPISLSKPYNQILTYLMIIRFAPCMIYPYSSSLQCSKPPVYCWMKPNRKSPCTRLSTPNLPISLSRPRNQILIYLMIIGSTSCMIFHSSLAYNVQKHLSTAEKCAFEIAMYKSADPKPAHFLV